MFTNLYGKLFHWIKANRVMLSNATSLVGTTAVTSGLGFIYTWVAARQFSPDAVGLASVAVSNMMLLGAMGMIGLGTLLITELPRQPGKEVSLISTGCITSGIAGSVIGAAFALVAPLISSQFAPLRGSVWTVMVFALGVGLCSSTSVLDQALIGVLRGNLQFWRNAFFSVVKLLLLILVGAFLLHKTGMAMYAVWTAGLALSVIVLFLYVVSKTGWQGKQYIPQKEILRKLGGEALKHHMLNMLLQIPPQIMPTLVTVLVSARMNAWFYISWMIANIVFVVPNSLTIVLHAMNSADLSMLRQRARLTVGLAFVISLTIVAVLFFGAPLVLGVFGKEYAASATVCLRFLLLAAFPGIIKNHYISLCRIRDRVAMATWGVLIGGGLEIAGAVVGGILYGLNGLSGGWLVAVVIEGIYMSPIVITTLWGKKGIEEALPDTQEMPLWMVDTMVMPAIPSLRRTTGDLQVRVPTTTLRETESVWMVDTIMQPVVKVPRVTSPRIPAVVPPHYDERNWEEETIIRPSVSSINTVSRGSASMARRRAFLFGDDDAILQSGSSSGAEPPLSGGGSDKLARAGRSEDRSGSDKGVAARGAQRSSDKMERLHSSDGGSGSDQLAGVRRFDTPAQHHTPPPEPVPVNRIEPPAEKTSVADIETMTLPFLNDPQSDASLPEAETVTLELHPSPAQKERRPVPSVSDLETVVFPLSSSGKASSPLTPASKESTGTPGAGKSETERELAPEEETVTFIAPPLKKGGKSGGTAGTPGADKPEAEREPTPEEETVTFVAPPLKKGGKSGGAAGTPGAGKPETERELAPEEETVTFVAPPYGKSKNVEQPIPVQDVDTVVFPPPATEEAAEANQLPLTASGNSASAKMARVDRTLLPKRPARKRPVVIPPGVRRDATGASDNLEQAEPDATIIERKPARGAGEDGPDQTEAPWETKTVALSPINGQERMVPRRPGQSGAPRTNPPDSTAQDGHDSSANSQETHEAKKGEGSV